MQVRLAALFTVFAVGLTHTAEAAQIGGRDRDNILAACAQTHDTCLQSCNAAHPANGNIIRDADNRICGDGCNAAYSKCINSVNFQSNKSSGQKKKQGGVLQSD